MGEEDRSVKFMLMALFFSALFLPVMGLFLALPGQEVFSADWMVSVLFGGGLFAFISTFIYLLWPAMGAPTFFTSLRARYRFNRTTRKVYVLRPKRYGGNVILDWDRVKAHTSWCAPREMEPDQIDDKFARQRRQKREVALLACVGWCSIGPRWTRTMPSARAKTFFGSARSWPEKVSGNTSAPSWRKAWTRCLLQRNTNGCAKASTHPASTWRKRKCPRPEYWTASAAVASIPRKPRSRS